MEKKRIDPAKIKIREFRIIKGQIDSPYDFHISDISSYDFNLDFTTGFNIDENLIKADFIINLKTVSAEPQQEATSLYHFVFLFDVENLGEQAQVMTDGSTDANPYLANAIASITYSTSRGILLSRFQGTVMRDFILPVIDPNSLFENKL